jgi:hypothetical protein
MRRLEGRFLLPARPWMKDIHELRKRFEILDEHDFLRCLSEAVDLTNAEQPRAPIPYWIVVAGNLMGRRAAQQDSEPPGLISREKDPELNFETKYSHIYQ